MGSIFIIGTSPLKIVSVREWPHLSTVQFRGRT